MRIPWTGPEVAIFYQACKKHKTDLPRIVQELGGTKTIEELQYVYNRHPSVLGLITSDNVKMTVEGLEAILMQDYEKSSPSSENSNSVDSDSELEGNHQDVLGEAVEDVNEEMIQWTGSEFERFCNACKEHQTNWPKIVDELGGTKSIADLECVYKRHHLKIGLVTSGHMTVNDLQSTLMKEDHHMMFVNSVSESEGNHLVAQGEAVEVSGDVVADELVQDGGVQIQADDVEEVNEMVQDDVEIQAEDGGVQIQADNVEEVNEMVQDDVGIQAEDGEGVGVMNAMAHDGGPKPPKRRRQNF